MAEPAPEFTPNDDLLTRSEVQEILRVFRRVFTEDNMRTLERLLSNPAARWKNRAH